MHAGDGSLLLEHASVAIVPGEFARAQDDVFRTIRDLGWGRLSLATAPAPAGDALDPWQGDAVDAFVVPSAAPLVRARTLAPDGKQGEILAWQHPVDADRIVIAVRVGHFGDAEQERQFINLFSRFLAGPPRPQRDATFTLPE